MFYITKTIEISASHRLRLPYESKCANVHGHNYLIKVRMSASKLNTEGMVVDFSHIARIINKFDHQSLNDFITQPTAENIALTIGLEIEALYPGKLSMVEVQEDRDNVAAYLPD